MKIFIGFCLLAVIFLSNQSRLVFADDTKTDGKFSNETELGIVVTGGNTSTQTTNLKEAAIYEWFENKIKLTAKYLQTSAASVESARNWGLGLRYERALTPTISAFAGQAFESDIYAGYAQRYLTDVGGKYFIEKSEDLVWLGELGYRYVSENSVTFVTTTSSFMRIYTEVVKNFNKTVSAKYWFEALPNFTLGSDYQLNTELSVTAAMSSIFSIKTGYLIKYRNLLTSTATNKTDTVFTTALVAKF